MPGAQPTTTLEYGTIATQFGVTCEHHADGGVTVTVPGSGGRYLAARLARSGTLTEAAIIAALYAGGRLFGRCVPPRAVVQITPQHVAITQPDPRARFKIWTMQTQTWPLTLGVEVRPNRYSKGIYVRIPGKENFDLLTDLDAALVEYVGRMLADALARVAAAEEGTREAGAEFNQTVPDRVGPGRSEAP